MYARGTFPRATVKASLNNYDIQPRESESGETANYLRKKKKKTCRLDYFFQSEKRYGKHMLAAGLQAVVCVGETLH